jgi:hypothetical protein
LLSLSKRLLKGILGPRVSGAVAYYRYPQLRDSWGGPFNGQIFRQRIFRELLEVIHFDVIAETGSYRGTTTDYLQRCSRLPVYTVELDPKMWGYVKGRFIFRKDVVIAEGDSRTFLKRFVNDPARHGKRVFFYLDAHWGEDLPLREEIQIIFTRCPDAVVMVDDFQVPGDPGYTFDDYGTGKVLCLEYLKDVAEQFKLGAFFPAVGSDMETGARRGCVVLAAAPETIDRLKSVASLKDSGLHR